MKQNSEATGAILDRLYAVIEQRRDADPETSWTAKLFEGGINKAAQKLGEEATETVVAALAESDRRLISEAADLVYHLLVLLASRGVSLSEVEAELARRAGVSGLDEKASRNK